MNTLIIQRNYAERLSQSFGISSRQVSATIQLFDEGNTIPFIARYRKEITGSLDELVLRKVSEELTKLRHLDDRKETVITAISEQNKLTDEVVQRLIQAESLTEVEDIYQPFKQKRRTRASIARENGLASLADMILSQPIKGASIEQVAQPFLNENVTNLEAAIEGAKDIVAEIINDSATVKQALRSKALLFGMVRSSAIDKEKDERGVYETYYEFSLRVNRLRPHQTLALNRGENEKILRVKVELEERDWMSVLDSLYPLDRHSTWAPILNEALQDAAKRLILPSIERDIRRHLTEMAEEHAIHVFADNLRKLLFQPPLSHARVMGIDPAYRTGCKIAIVDTTGKLLTTQTIYPHKPQERTTEAKQILNKLIQYYQVGIIAIGNGTASRETEQLVAEITQQNSNVKYLIVNEAGASVYSASDLARAELPELDVSIRGAVSIARRVLDPLAELVKIDPKSVGVGLYQHDVNQKALSEQAQDVVESVVNHVGVDLNTASPALLGYVSGINQKVAQAIVAYRDTIGQFQQRSQLLKVTGLGKKAYEQCAGFLRIRQGHNTLDTTAIHPESYSATNQLLMRCQINHYQGTPEEKYQIQAFLKTTTIEQVAQELGIGVPTLTDIIEQLFRPGRDPREDVPVPLLRSDVLNFDDLKVGMRLSGTVRNVVDFGVFIDIGVKQDGLLHNSQIQNGERLQLGDIVEVEILAVDVQRQRIGLGMYHGIQRG